MSRRYHYLPPIPSSTPTVLVFPYDKQLKRFNTSAFMPQLVQGRTTHQELEAFMDEIMVPVEEYYKKYGFIHHPTCGWICLQIICYMICPLAIIMMCYLIHVANESKLKMAECKQKVEMICKQRGMHFMEKDMMWVVPNQQFPRWIEFWTTLGNNNNNHNQSFNNHSMIMTTQGQDISMMPMLQQGYQQQNYGMPPQQQNYPPQQRQGYPPQQNGYKIHPEYNQNMNGGNNGFRG